MERIVVKFESDEINEFDDCANIPFTRNPYYHPYSYVYPNIYSKAKGDHSKITKDDVGNAMDIIAAYMMQDYRFDLVLDLAERNKALSPAKEMTIAEIEEELGYKIKIVKDQEE